jgi:hypothetical protein
MMTNTRHLFPGLWKMDFISARLTKLSTQRAIIGFVALLVTSVTFWCLISGDDALPNSSTHHSDGVNIAPRGTVKIQTPGAIAGLVVGTILGVLAIGIIVSLFYCVYRLKKAYQGSDSTVKTRDLSTVSDEHYRFYTGDIRLRSFGDPGPPKQFWRPTELERDLASRISMDEGPSLAIPTSAKQAPLKSSVYDPVFELSSPDLESKILHPESVTPVLTSS